MTATERPLLRVILSFAVLAGSAAYVTLQGAISNPFVAPDGPGEVTTTEPVGPVAPEAVMPAVRLTDGLFRGKDFSAYYGLLAVKITVEQGRIATVQAYRYPKDRKYSADLNKKALPILYSEAIAAQKAEVDAVTGVTFTSEAYVKSLQSAIDKARK